LYSFSPFLCEPLPVPPALFHQDMRHVSASSSFALVCIFGLRLQSPPALHWGLFSLKKGTLLISLPALADQPSSNNSSLSFFWFQTNNSVSVSFRSLFLSLALFRQKRSVVLPASFFSSKKPPHVQPGVPWGSFSPPSPLSSVFLPLFPCRCVLFLHANLLLSLLLPLRFLQSLLF